MTWNDVAVKATLALIPVIALALTVLLSLAADYLRQKAAGVRGEVARESLLAAIFEAERVGVDAVAATQQMLVEDLKAASADGKLTPSERVAAMAKASDYFRGHITPGALRVLEASYGPVDRWLRDYLEARLVEYRGGTAAVVGDLARPT
jgi:hypothetical protein